MRFTGHKTFLAFDGGYHGSTLAVSISTAEQAIDRVDCSRSGSPRRNEPKRSRSD